MVPYLRAANVADGSLDLSDVKEMDFTPAEQDTFALRDGDVLVTEGSGSLSAVGATAVYREELGRTVCFQNTLLRLRPRSEHLDSRFLAWWARGAYENGAFAAVATGANIHHLGADGVKSMGLPLPGLRTQRRVADYLDRETKRINGILRSNERLVSLIDERWQSRLALATRATAARQVPLQHLVRAGKPIIYGIVLPGPNVEEGVPLIKGGDVHGHRLAEGVPNKVAFGIERDKTRSRVEAGDLVYAIRGSFGDVDVVPAVLEGANITQDVARISPDPRQVDGPWLLYALRSPEVADQAKRVALGATISGVNIGDLRRFRIPVPPLPEQRTLASELRREEAELEGLQSRLRSQNELLLERRQALITAAVTGQLDLGEAA